MGPVKVRVAPYYDKMALDKSLSSAKRFGARYGRKVRHRFAKIESEQKKAHKCPYCGEPKVKRIAAGIWNCKKCSAKFTGKAYTIPKKVIIRAAAAAGREEIEAMEEQEEVQEEMPDEEKPQKYKEAMKTEEQGESPVEEELKGTEKKIKEETE